MDSKTPAAPPSPSVSASSAPPPSREDILRGIATIARDQVGWEGPVEPEMRLVEDLHLDSLRLLTLAVAVEDRFRVCLDEADETAIETVGDLVAVVARKTVRESEGEDPDA